VGHNGGLSTTVSVRISRGVSGKRAIAAGLLGVAGLFALDGLMFRTPLYRRILEPDSSAGEFEYVLRRERHAQNDNGYNLVLTMGDSRFAFSPRRANLISPQTGYIFRHGGVAGTSPRAWYFMLRDLDPSARRYRAVVMGVPNYYDEDEHYNPANDIRDLHYVIERLRWSDIFDFAWSFPKSELKWQAVRGGMLKGMVLQRDIHEFLAHPVERWKKVELERRGFDTWSETFEETTRSMAGVEIDWEKRSYVLPPDPDQGQRDTVASQMLGVAPQTGSLAAFRRKWMGRIVERYRGSRTRVIFIRLPRGPIPRPNRMQPEVGSVIREFATRPGVSAAEEHYFDSLEHPELFKDAIHLNNEGIARFSPMLAEKIARMLRQ
jgi:hypothetical protein